MAEQITIEVAYATKEKQVILETQVDAGTSVFDAAANSGIDQRFPEIDFEATPMGIFGKKVMKPKSQTVNAGERIELYRPLLIDPKQARANRAAKKAAE